MVERRRDQGLVRPLDAEISRRNVLRFGAVAGAATLAAPLLSGRGASASVLSRTRDGSTVARGGTLVGAFDEGPGGAPQQFNPLLATAGMTWLQMYYSPLVLWDVNFTRLQGELAKSWEVTPDGLQYTFNLRKGVTWHDGQPFTADDVKFTFELALNPASAAYVASELPPVKSIDTPNPDTVIVHLSSPSASLMSVLAWMVILPQHALAKISPKSLLTSSWWHTNPVGTGPFMWKKWVTDQYTELSAFDNYWRGRPVLDSVINEYYSQESSSVIAMEKGSSLFDLYITLPDIPVLKSTGKVNILSGPSQVFNYLAWNLRQPRFQDKRIRQAFMYAIDRQAIVQKLYQGGATIVPGPYDQPAYKLSKPETYAYNPNLAKKLLNEANWDKIQGAPINLITYYTDQTTLNVLESMQAMLGQVGITILLQQVQAATYTADVSGHNFDMVFAGIADGPDPGVSAEIFTKSSAPTSNFMGITDTKIFDLYAKGKETVDLSRRAAIYKQINEEFNRSLPVGPMWVAKRFGAVSKRIKNFQFTPAPGGGQYYAGWQDWSLT
jgi:peptide/nickel transport system substrate-binding protein